MLQQTERVLRQLAPRFIVAHGDQCRGKVRHDGRQLRRRRDSAKHLQRFMEIANGFIDAVGEVVRRAERVRDPEPVSRREELLCFGIYREQPFACRKERLLDDHQSCATGIGKQFAATVR